MTWPLRRVQKRRWQQITSPCMLQLVKHKPPERNKQDTGLSSLIMDAIITHERSGAPLTTFTIGNVFQRGPLSCSLAHKELLVSTMQTWKDSVCILPSPMHNTTEGGVKIGPYTKRIILLIHSFLSRKLISVRHRGLRHCLQIDKI